MHFPIPWLVLATVLVGHFGFWLLLFNRINATGLKRRTIKRSEKLLLLVAVIIPLIVVWSDYASLASWLSSNGWWPKATRFFDFWGWLSLATVAIAGPFWLESRHALRCATKLTKETVQHYLVSQHVDGELMIDPVFRWFSMLPGNQISQLEVTHKEIELPRIIQGIDGLKIGHLSDIHLTGKISQEYYRFAFERLLEAQPDLIVITGDIIDYASCLPWVSLLLGRLQAPLGCSFVLGNHDRRLEDITPLVDALNGLGHYDLGRSDLALTTDQGAGLWLTGNERPWFRRHAVAETMTKPADTMRAGRPGDATAALRIGVCHSPDQIGWARQLGIDLMLAGHTHGGQIRIPGIGPLVVPSYYGSRFASGVFYLPPTVMHVGRGLSGVHPVRWFCPPEVAILTLRNPAPSRPSVAAT